MCVFQDRQRAYSYSGKAYCTLDILQTEGSVSSTHTHTSACSEVLTINKPNKCKIKLFLILITQKTMSYSDFF